MQPSILHITVLTDAGKQANEVLAFILFKTNFNYEAELLPLYGTLALQEFKVYKSWSIITPNSQNPFWFTLYGEVLLSHGGAIYILLSVR